MSFIKMVLMLAVMLAVNQTVAKRPRRKRSVEKHEEIKTVPLHLDLDSLAPATNSRPLHKDSISPWTFSTTFDPSLYPPSLSEAHCVLRGCLDADGVEDLNLESKPIMRQVVLLRRVHAANCSQTYHYHLESRLLAVGCTCVAPVKLRQD